MSHRQLGVKRPGPTARDQRTTAIVDHLLQEERRQRRTDTWLEERDGFSSVLKLEDGVNAVLRVEEGHLARLTLCRHPADDIAEEACDSSHGHVDVDTGRGAQVRRGLDERGRIRVELEYRIRGAQGTARAGAGSCGRAEGGAHAG